MVVLVVVVLVVVVVVVVMVVSAILVLFVVGMEICIVRVGCMVVVGGGYGGSGC